MNRPTTAEKWLRVVKNSLWRQRQACLATTDAHDEVQAELARLRAANEQLRQLNQTLQNNLQERTQALEKLAITDPLTGAYNRRFFLERADIEVAQAQRQGQELSLVMLDIDWFKRINAAHGHAMGDLALVQLCSTVKHELRLGDTFARIGGEEFVLLLPQTNKSLALQVAERLRGQIASLTIPTADADPIQFTASFGVATLSDTLNTAAALLRAAESALYRAQNTAGRNRVMSFRPQTPTQAAPRRI